MLYRLAYISSFVGRATQADLDDILRSARRKNGADGITGFLLFHDGNFFQVLEGAEEKVVACYDRIVGDSRHRGSIILQSEQTESRMFSDWEMGYVPFADLGPTHQKGFVDLQDFRNSAKMRSMGQDPVTSVFVNRFLSSFRDLIPA